MQPGADAEIRALPFGQAVRCALAMHTCPVSFWAVVERRDAEGMLPAVFAPRLLTVLLGPAGRWLALAALVLAVWGHGWMRGAAHEEAKAEALRAKQEAAALEHAAELAKAAAEVDAITMQITTTVRERAKVITREVPVYVTREADARCTVPVGLERLWHLNLQAVPDPAPAGSGNDAASRLALSDVARGVVEAKERFALNRATAEACQAWVRKISPADSR